MRLRPFVASELDAIVLLLMCSPHSGVRYVQILHTPTLSPLSPLLFIRANEWLLSRSNAFKLLPLIHRLNLVMPEGFTDKRTRLYTILQQQSRTIIRNARARFTDMRTGLVRTTDDYDTVASA